MFDKEAYWVKGVTIQRGGKVTHTINCTACNGSFKYGDLDAEGLMEDFAFCPFCGAEMHGEAGEEYYV